MEFSKRDLLNDTATTEYKFYEYLCIFRICTDCFFLRVTNNTMITRSRDLDRTF